MKSLHPESSASQETQLCLPGSSFAVEQISKPRRTRKRLVPGRGGLLVFEGPDGVGKSTISHALADYLGVRGFDCRWSSFPGQEEGTLGRVVYEHHHHLGHEGWINSLDPTALQLLHVAAHLDEINRKLMPAIRCGKLVILDRYWWSTWVYGRLAQIAVADLRRMISLETSKWSKIRPAAVLLLSRTAQGDQESNIHSQLVREYASLVEREGRKYPICAVQNDRSIDEILKYIIEAIGVCFQHDKSPKPNKLTTIIEFNQLDLGFGCSTSLPKSNVDFEFMKKRNRDIPRINRFAPAKPTVVLDTYWYLAAERQRIFFHRLNGEPPPWTADLILREHKFTNAYRASDRVSQYLISRVIYEGEQTPEEIFFRTILFKFFNRIETWELLTRHLGVVSYREYSFDRYDAILSQAIDAGRRIYSAAYIMPSGGAHSGTTRKHRMHLQLLGKMMADQLPVQLTDAATMAKAFDLLRAYPTIGDFLAYQYVTDLNYSTLTNFEEMTFVVPGPGARDGIRKCFSDFGGLNEVELIRQVTLAQQDEFRDLGLDFQSLWGRNLQLIDCQNIFCEVDKYARVKHPEFVGRTGRTRIKQKFHRDPTPLRLMYPPKWDINKHIPAEVLYVSNVQR